MPSNEIVTIQSQLSVQDPTAPTAVIAAYEYGQPVRQQTSATEDWLEAQNRSAGILNSNLRQLAEPGWCTPPTDVFKYGQGHSQSLSGDSVFTGYYVERDTASLPDGLAEISCLLHGGKAVGRLAVNSMFTKNGAHQLVLMPADLLQAGMDARGWNGAMLQRSLKASGEAVFGRRLLENGKLSYPLMSEDGGRVGLKYKFDPNSVTNRRASHPISGVDMARSQQRDIPARANLQRILNGPFTESQLALQALQGLHDVLTGENTGPTIDWVAGLAASEASRQTSLQVFEAEFSDGRPFTIELDTTSEALPPMLRILASDLGIEQGRPGQTIFATLRKERGDHVLSVVPARRSPDSTGIMLSRDRSGNNLRARKIDDPSIVSTYKLPEVYDTYKALLNRGDLLLDTMFDQVVVMAAQAKSEQIGPVQLNPGGE